MKVETEKEEEFSCGSFMIDQICVNVYGQRYASFTNNSIQPLSAKSRLVFQFSQEVNIEFVQEFVFSLRRCFFFLCRRKTICFDSIMTFSIIKENQRNSFGEFVFMDKIQAEHDPKLKDRIIYHDFLGENFGRLLQFFVNYEVYTAHIPKSYIERNSYEHDRMIFDCVAFEKEFKTLFPEVKIRSKPFLDVKNDILSSVDTLIYSYKGEKKKKSKSLRKSIENIDISLEERIKKALKMHMDIMDIFIRKEYGKNTLATIENCAIRINELRNAFAHGNVDYDILPNHLTDLKIIEILYYAMRLKACGIETMTVQKAICQLFGFNMAK